MSSERIDDDKVSVGRGSSDGIMRWKAAVRLAADELDKEIVQLVCVLDAAYLWLIAYHALHPVRSKPPAP